MVNKGNFSFHENINISNLHYPFLIVDSEGLIVDSNDRACKLFKLKRIPEDFLLKKGGNKSFLLAFLKTILENRCSNHTYFYPISVNDKHLKVFNTIYFIFSYLKSELCLIKIKNIDFYNELESEYIRIIKYGEALNKSSLVLNKLDKGSPIKALSYIRNVSGASRIYIYKNFTSNKSEDLSSKCIEEICASNIPSVINNPDFSFFKYKDGLSRWQRYLSEGRLLSGYVKDFPKSELKYLVPQGIEYIIIVPIITDSGWFGFVGLDYCYKNVKTTVLDIMSLSTISKQLSNYYFLSRIEKLSLSANEKMSNDLDFQNKMISLMSNSIKNSLNEIIVLSTKLNSNIETFSEKKVIEYSQLIHNAARSVNNTVDYTSEFIENIYTDKNYDLKLTSAIEIISKSISSLKESASQKSIILLNKSKKDFSLYTDKDIVLSIFKNIVFHAIRFSCNGTIIEMSCKRDPKIKDNVLLCFKDCGLIISKEKMTRIYEPVYKIPQKIDMDISLRLGMQISKRILHNIHGSIYAESIESEGYYIYISLPEYKDRIDIMKSKK